MNKVFTMFATAAMSAVVTASAQSVPVAYSLSQHDLRGTARFMSMGGAFGALGGDLSTLSQNPGGIGIYRNNDVGFTVALDAQSAKNTSGGFAQTDNLTRFNLNSVGGVFTVKLPANVMPNINFGLTYHKLADFNRKFGGRIPNLRTSLSNYIAGVCNANGLIEADVATTENFDPYNPNDGYARGSLDFNHGLRCTACQSGSQRRRYKMVRAIRRWHKRHRILQHERERFIRRI